MSRLRPWQPGEAALIEEIRDLLLADRLVAVPTETFYALAAHPFRSPALERLFAVKGRPVGKPILLLVAGPEMLKEVAADIPAVALRLMARFWPGPLTLILPARPELPALLTGGTGTIGVRQPRREAALALIEGLGFPLTGTSANRSSRPPAATPAEVARELGGEVDLILDDGPCPGGLPSTVVDLTTHPPCVRRKGALPVQELMDMLPELAISGEAHG